MPDDTGLYVLRNTGRGAVQYRVVDNIAVGMPPSRRSATKQDASVLSRAIPHFEIPPDHHLLVTTPSCISAWDTAGLHKIFRSSKSSIVAARETKDGSNVLAVADQHVVVLHDTRRGWEKSWGLNADEDEVRLLEYAPDAKTLFLSTTLTNEVQQYSTEQSQLMSPTHSHATPLIALAVSSTGHLMLTASDNPPALYLKSLLHNSEPVMIIPRASDTPVTVASFHPERANIFLLAFRDGTIAAYDATRIVRRAQGQGRFSDQERVNDGEIAHIDNLHRPTTKIVTKDSIGVRATSITAAAFLPGHKTRAICAGSDGRCRMVDFNDGGIVLRTWHAKAPVTSLSVVSTELTQAKPAHIPKNAAKIKGVDVKHSMCTNSIIAIGRSDGKVHIYDSVGLLLSQKTVGQDAQRIISVEWVRGTSPQTVANVVNDVEKREPAALGTRSSNLGGQRSKQLEPVREAACDTEEVIVDHHLGLPPTLHQPCNQASETTPITRRRFTIHPDEIEEGSVRHTFLERPSVPQFSAPANAFVDLFSPIKSTVDAAPEAAKKLIISPPRSRPRISSQTFAQDSKPSPFRGTSFAAKRDEIPIHEPLESSNTDLNTSKRKNHHFNELTSGYSGAVGLPRAKQRRSPRKSLRPPQEPTEPQAATQLNENAQILANLRKLSSKQRTGSVLAPFASTVIPPKPQHGNTISHIARRNNYLKKHRLFSPAVQKVWDPGNVLEREAAWVTDSNQDRSSDELEDAEPDEGAQANLVPTLGDTDGSADIWMTSADETASSHLQARRRKRRKPLVKPDDGAARGDPLSRLRSLPASSVYSQSVRSKVDGSTTEDMLSARTHFSPEQGLSPSSKDICNLFPRTSSLSPRTTASRAQKSRQVQSSRRQGLKEMNPNMSPLRKSPWARAKASKTASATAAETLDGTPEMVRSPSMACFDCASNGPRIARLEGDVLQLKGEVLALKAMLRRHGLPLPPGLV
nr:hypothetical protein CFP56_58217 [Quercus suber]